MVGSEEYLTLFSGNGWTIYDGCSGAAISLSANTAYNRNCVCVINGNNTNQSGGAVRVTCGCLTLNDSIFDCNRTSYCGGAIYACGSGTCVAVNNSCMEYCSVCASG